jgi:alpha-galactosidase
MPHYWQFEHTPRGAQITHHSQSYKLADFVLRVNYRNEYRMRSEELALMPDLANCNEKEAVFTAASQKFHLNLRFNLKSQALKVSASFTAQQTRVVESVELLIKQVMVGAHGHNLRVFKNGFQSWSETRSFDIDEREQRVIMRWFDVLQANGSNRPSGKRGEFTSETFTLVRNKDQRVTLLIGQQPPFHQFFSLRTHFPVENIARNVFSVLLRWEMNGRRCQAQTPLKLDTVSFQAGRDANQLLDQYLIHLALPVQRQHALPSGWCSWYYYYERVTQEDILNNARLAAENEVDWQFFVLDDGYQRAIGDWLSLNDKFSGGLKPLAERIRENGMQPGIWTAPFITMKDSRLMSDHPDWVLTQPFNDRPVLAGWNPSWSNGFSFYALDVTHPGVQAYLKEVFTTLVHTFGYEFLKLDFVYAASLPGKPHDPSLSGAERLNLGYRLIREAAGRDTFLLGCGSPLTPAVGWVDAMRIGPDVAPYWDDWLRQTLLNDSNALSTRVAIRSILNRCQMHRRLWINDPDCLMLRDSETKLSQAERFSLINAAIITAGMGVFSDDLARLPQDAWQTIEQIKRLSLVCDSGRPYALDFMEREIPELVYNDAGYLAVFNFSDYRRQKNLPLKGKLRDILQNGKTLVDVWNGDTIPVQGEALSLGMFARHASRLFEIV